MYAIYFCDADFNTAGMPDLTPRSAALVRELSYATAPGDGETTGDTIHLSLEGTPDAIVAWLGQLERLLVQAQREAGIPGGAHCFLVCQVAFADTAWRSKVLGGRVTLAPGGPEQRAQGGQRVTLALRRADWWERAESAVLLAMQNPQGATSVDGLAISNHADAGHSNRVDLPQMHLAQENVTGELAAPPNLHISTPDPANTAPLTLFVGLSHRKNVEQLSAAYPGANGAARGGAVGTLTSDTGSANGQYLRLDWSGAEEREVWGVDIPSADALILAGYPVLPLLRLGLAAPAGVDFWYRWKVYTLQDGQEYQCAESTIQPLEGACALLSGPSLNLPPWLVDSLYPYGTPVLRLVLSVQAAGTGAHALGVDSLYLMGLDGWRIYRPLTTQPTRGISDYGERGTLYRYQERSQSHAAEGPGFLLQPGQAHRFIIMALSQGVAEKSVPIDLPMQVWVFHRPRKRNL